MSEDIKGIAAAEAPQPTRLSVQLTPSEEMTIMSLIGKREQMLAEVEAAITEYSRLLAGVYGLPKGAYSIVGTPGNLSLRWKQPETKERANGNAKEPGENV